MIFSKEYVGYLARELTKKLIAAGQIETSHQNEGTASVHAALLEELTLADRMNDEWRGFMVKYSVDVRIIGAMYEEMFKRWKGGLVRQSQAVLYAVNRRSSRE